MHAQQENTSPPSGRPSFFSVPEGVRNWAHVGPRFWAGVLCGFSLGVFAARCLVDLEVLTTQRNFWIMAPVLVLLWIGMMIAMRAVSRDRKSETKNSQSAESCR
jgi:hypothetical protein